ncbi:MAG: heme biosynthesis protein HemY [Planctomycetota bacterium]|nr:MAG: heme biosynthesis protein HemY [Planctomycetota bacterium]
MITLTDKAVSEVKRIISEQGLDEAPALRVGVSGGGCSGFSYVMTFDNDKKEGDQVMELDGVRVVLDAEAEAYLDNMVIDFNDDLSKRGFVFNNPNASDNCGCGNSFSV